MEQNFYHCFTASVPNVSSRVYFWYNLFFRLKTDCLKSWKKLRLRLLVYNLHSGLIYEQATMLKLGKEDENSEEFFGNIPKTNFSIRSDLDYLWKSTVEVVAAAVDYSSCF